LFWGEASLLNNLGLKSSFEFLLMDWDRDGSFSAWFPHDDVAAGLADNFEARFVKGFDHLCGL